MAGRYGSCSSTCRWKAIEIRCRQRERLTAPPSRTGFGNITMQCSRPANGFSLRQCSGDPERAVCGTGDAADGRRRVVNAWWPLAGWWTTGRNVCRCVGARSVCFCIRSRLDRRGRVSFRSARYYDVTTYVSYRVTVKLEGRARTYRAVALFRESPGRPPEFWDSIVSGVATVWEEKAIS